MYFTAEILLKTHGVNRYFSEFMLVRTNHQLIECKEVDSLWLGLRVGRQKDVKN
jgi:hypothetical protein